MWERTPPSGDSFGSERHYPTDLGLEPVHLEIDLTFDLARRSIAGGVTTTIEARREGASLVVLDAVEFQCLTVSDPEGRALNWHYDGRQIHVCWREPFARQEQRRLAVEYQVIEPASGLIFAGPDEAYPDQPFTVASENEPERARHWLPCVDQPIVRTSLVLSVRADRRFTVLASGIKAGDEEHGDGTRTVTWRLAQRCPSYLICVAIGELIELRDLPFQDGQKEVELATYASRSFNPDILRRTFGRARSMMAWLTGRLGLPFPFEKYYQVAVPGQSGAMENLSLVAWDERFLLDATLEPELAWMVDRINVHEIAHSYFGNTVVCRDFAHVWLKEGWATYLGQCYMEETCGRDEGMYVYHVNAQQYFHEADDRYGRPIVSRRYRSSDQLFDAHSYQGAACRLHTLRGELGDSLFWGATKDYLRRYDGRVVETGDLRRVMEDHSGRSLERFFEQWFYCPGYPRVRFSFRYDARERRGTFEIEQLQATDQCGAPVFLFTTELSWTLGGEEHRVPLRVDSSHHVVAIPMDDAPDQVRLDPDCRVLHRAELDIGDPLLRAQLVAAADAFGRIQAADALARSGRRVNIESIIAAYATEPFWGARCEFARGLSRVNTEIALGGLLQFLATERDQRVLPALLGALGRYRDPRVRRALVERLEEGLPYLAAQAAYQALGAQRQDAPWELLCAASRKPGYLGYAQSGALRALGATRRPDAADLLISALQYGATPQDARPAAAEALGELARGLEGARREAAVARLVDLLRDPWFRVRQAAARGLGSAKAVEALDDLEQYARSCCREERVQVEDLVTGLRAADTRGRSELIGRLDRLDEQVRRVEEQLQRREERPADG